jgi:hypothetical protein
MMLLEKPRDDNGKRAIAVVENQEGYDVLGNESRP